MLNCFPVIAFWLWIFTKKRLQLQSLGFYHIQNKAEKVISFFFIKILTIVLRPCRLCIKTQMKWALRANTFSFCLHISIRRGQEVRPHKHTCPQEWERGPDSVSQRVMDESEGGSTPPHLSLLPSKAHQNLSKRSEGSWCWICRNMSALQLMFHITVTELCCHLVAKTEHNTSLWY